MTRPLRIECPGAVCHTTGRGNARQEIYHGDTDREAFLKILAQVVERFGWLCHAYCLMANHVEKEGYLLELARYVVLNPVRAGIVSTAKGWPWSSYRATAGFSPPPSFLTTDWILSQFGGTTGKAREAYRRFVGEGRGASPWEGVRGQIYLGSDGFIAARSQKTQPLRAVPQAQYRVGQPGLDDLLMRDPSGQAIVGSYRTHGYTMREIADSLGVHYATVSRRIRRHEQRVLDRKT